MFSRGELKKCIYVYRSILDQMMYFCRKHKHRRRDTNLCHLDTVIYVLDRIWFPNNQERVKLTILKAKKEKMMADDVDRIP